VGSGTAGCSVASKLAYRYGEGKVVVLDDAEVRGINLIKKI
jgi:succinate dehydrogenase/fumarate reductase flavoprotein subunit